MMAETNTFTVNRAYFTVSSSLNLTPPPKGQIDYKWSEGELKNISEFKGIRVYKYDTRLTDRAELISRERSLSTEIWHNETC
jgi:hypothetical protein